MNDVEYSAGEKLSRGIELIKEALVEILSPVIETVKSSIPNFGNLINQLQTEELAAISWARSERPNWYAIYCRTKKKRIRKKCLDKITREYRRVHQYGES